MASLCLPGEVTEDILSKLPVKSLLRFQTASKKWYSLISQDHKFAEFHLKQSKNLMIFKNITGTSIFQSWDMDNHASSKIYFPGEIEKPCRLIGSANGLICVSPCYEWSYCFIWNPSTTKFKKIPVAFPDYNLCSSLFGFGYDSFSDDYKILGVWHLSNFQIFSLKTNSWKIFEFPFSYKSSKNAFHSHGALHWCVGRQIACFDLEKEKISFIDLPEEFNYNAAWVPLFDYQGSLCASDREFIWVMKEYGNTKSWAKFSTLLPLEYAKPIGISGHGEVIFGTNTGIVKADIHGRMSDDDKWQLLYFVGNTFLYQESLISPKCLD